MKFNKRPKGFTLIEALIVVIIVAIGNFGNQRNNNCKQMTITPIESNLTLPS